jgi:hypothetical protein
MRFLTLVALLVMLWVPVDASGQDAMPSFCPCSTGRWQTCIGRPPKEGLRPPSEG